MKDSGKALVSVIITTYHNEAYLPRAIDSVLHQSYSNIELIVVDDNPPESSARAATEAIMAYYPNVIYLRHSKNRNGAAARNTGIRAAKGEYIAFLDNDDLYFGDHIANCVEALGAHPEYGCVLCGVVKICGGLCWDLIPAMDGDLVKTLLFSETALGTGSNLFVKADIVRALDGFDESFMRHQDIEFCVRLFSICPAYRLDRVEIVKEMDGFSNAPDFERFLKTKQHFWNTFECVLRTLTEDEKKRYYSGQYSSLLYAACKGGDSKQISWTIRQRKKYRPLGKRELLLIFLSKMHLFRVYEAVKICVKRRNSRRLYDKIAMDLTEYDLKLFLQALSGVKKEQL